MHHALKQRATCASRVEIKKKKRRESERKRCKMSPQVGGILFIVSAANDSQPSQVAFPELS